MDALQDFNIYTRKQWMKDWHSHQHRLKGIHQSPSLRVDNGRPAFFNSDFRKTQSKEFRKQGSLHAEAERIIAKANHQLSSRLTNVEFSLKKQQESGFIRRSKSTYAHKLQKELIVCQENQRLVKQLSEAQPSVATARDMESEFLHSRFFQELRRKPLLTVNMGQSKAPMSFRTASCPDERSAHSTHILMPITSLAQLRSHD